MQPITALNEFCLRLAAPFPNQACSLTSKSSAYWKSTAPSKTSTHMPPIRLGYQPSFSPQPPTPVFPDSQNKGGGETKLKLVKRLSKQHEDHWDVKNKPSRDVFGSFPREAFVSHSERSAMFESNGVKIRKRGRKRESRDSKTKTFKGNYRWKSTKQNNPSLLLKD